MSVSPFTMNDDNAAQGGEYSAMKAITPILLGSKSSSEGKRKRGRTVDGQLSAGEPSTSSGLTRLELVIEAHAAEQRKREEVAAEELRKQNEEAAARQNRMLDLFSELVQVIKKG